MEDQVLINKSIKISIIGLIISGIGFSILFTTIFHWYFNNFLLLTQLISYLELLLFGFYLISILIIISFQVFIFIRERNDDNSLIHYAICIISEFFIIVPSIISLCGLITININSNTLFIIFIKGTYMYGVAQNYILFSTISHSIILIGSLVYLLPFLRIFREKKKIDKILTNQIENLWYFFANFLDRR